MTTLTKICPIGRRSLAAAMGAVAAVCLITVFCGAAQAADKIEGSADIRSVYAELDDGVYYVYARLEIALSSQALGALRNGVPLNIELQLRVDRFRRWIWDDTIAQLKQRYRLTHHALSDRYVVTNINSGDKASFADLETALAFLGRVDRLPLIDESLLDEDGRYEAAARVTLDVKELSGPLRFLSRFWADWRISSEWYRWPLGT